MAAGTLIIDNLESSTGAVNRDTADLINGACTAWVNWNGVGTVAIDGSFNVSSVTDNGVGDYTLNFATAMSNANYAVSLQGTTYSATNTVITMLIRNASWSTKPATKTVNGCRVLSCTAGSPTTKYDMAELNAVFFGGQ